MNPKQSRFCARLGIVDKAVFPLHCRAALCQTDVNSNFQRDFPGGKTS
jgi:hypothetical protein